MNPTTAFEPYPNPKNSTLVPQEIQNDPQIRSTLNVRIYGSIEKKLFTYMSRPQNLLDPDPNFKNTQLGPQKVKKKTN